MKKKAGRTSIQYVIEEAKWKRDPRAIAAVRRAARAALKAGRKSGGKAALTILLADDARLKALNHDFRGKRKPTNVLSFPAFAASATGYLGDIAIAYGVTAREAKAQKKTFAAHAAHLAAHGVLHLLGYDHESDKEAKRMEGLETRLLMRMGLPDPYANGPVAGLD